MGHAPVKPGASLWAFFCLVELPSSSTTGRWPILALRRYVKSLIENSRLPFVSEPTNQEPRGNNYISERSFIALAMVSDLKSSSTASWHRSVPSPKLCALWHHLNYTTILLTQTVERLPFIVIYLAYPRGNGRLLNDRCTTYFQKPEQCYPIPYEELTHPSAILFSTNLRDTPPSFNLSPASFAPIGNGLSQPVIYYHFILS